MVEYSLYFHIPFCTKKCPYCHFYVIPDLTRFKELYMEALKLEWQRRSKLLPRGKLVSLYFGGGTPTLLGPERIATLLSWISPPPECEITIEANPENPNLSSFRKIGVNRLSLGVQSFNEHQLTRLGRTHTASQAIERVMESGFENLSIDLMYDLPHQTLPEWEKTLESATKLPITHLSLYNLTIEPHTSFYKNPPPQPSQEKSLQMLELAVHKLEAAGLQRYEISAFAKPSHTSRHNTGYWTGRPFLGLGPSAFSYWEGRRFRNIAHLHRYAKALKRGEDPTDFEERLSPIEAAKEQLAIGLRLFAGVPLDTLPQHWIAALSEWTEIHEGRLRLTDRGRLFHDTVAETIMTTLN